jgi:hypothetical protein
MANPTETNEAGVVNLKEKAGSHIEDAEAAGYVNSPREIQSRFDLLRDLSEPEMEVLNKRVLRKVDWRMMPTITIMFLMW